MSAKSLASNDPFERAVQRSVNDHVGAGFRQHVIIFACVNVALVAVWAVWSLAADDWFPWFAFVLIGWGLGLGAHYTHIRRHHPPVG